MTSSNSFLLLLKCRFSLLFTVFLAFVSVNQAATFKIDHQTVPSGATTVTVPIKVSDFTDTGAFQFTLIWDAAVLSFKNLGDFNHSPTLEASQWLPLEVLDGAQAWQQVVIPHTSETHFLRLVPVTGPAL